MNKEQFDKMHKDKKRKLVEESLANYLIGRTLNPFAGPPSKYSRVVEWILEDYVKGGLVERR